MHGIAADCHSDKSKQIASIIKEATGSSYVKVICLGADTIVDVKASILGDANEYVDEIAKQLASDEALHDGFDFVGASQGGLLARAYVERYNSPPVRRLLTLGTPHSGISSIPGCGENGGMRELAIRIVGGFKSIDDLIRSQKDAKLSPEAKANLLSSLLCAILEGATVFGLNKKSKIMPKYYFRKSQTVNQFPEGDSFIGDLNNDESVNEKYAENLKKLDKFIMIKFGQDQIVVPNESTQFGWRLGQTDIPFSGTPAYSRLGLDGLKREGKLAFDTIDNKHMMYSHDQLFDVFKKHLA